MDDWGDWEEDDTQGLPPLMAAIKKGDKALAAELIKQGTDVNIFEPDECRTPLMLAASIGDGQTCRILLQHGADVEMKDKFHNTAEQIADKNYPHLSELLSYVRRTKWRPGLAPSLMKQVDHDKFETNPFDTLQMKEETAVEMILEAANGSKYIENVKEHKINYVHFLKMEDEDLEEIGVEEPEVRQEILSHIRKIRTAHWIQTMPSNKTLKLTDAICLLAESKSHLAFIRSKLRYMKNRIMEKPTDLKFDLERNSIETIIKRCDESKQKLGVIVEKSMELSAIMRAWLNIPDDEVASNFTPRKRDREEKKKQLQTRSMTKHLILGSSGVVLLSVLIYQLYKRCNY